LVVSQFEFRLSANTGQRPKVRERPIHVTFPPFGSTPIV
jgi:hypothetical protein